MTVYCIIAVFVSYCLGALTMAILVAASREVPKP